MHKYEIMYILNSEDQNLKTLQEKLHLILTNNDGKIEEFGDWGIRNLSYPIKKHKKGYYGVLIVTTASANIEEFRRITGIEHNVLRTLIINTEKEKNYEQSTVYAKTEVKNERQERKPNRRFEKKEISSDVENTNHSNEENKVDTKKENINEKNNEKSE